MSRAKKMVSLFMMVALMLAMSVTAFAAEKKVTLDESKDGYMVISGYDSEVQPEVFLASSPVKVSFYGTDLAREVIYRYSNATCDSLGNITTNFNEDNWEDGVVEIPLDVEKFDSNSGLYTSGNYVTLTGTGIYNVIAGPEAAVGTSVYIVITGAPVTATPTSSTVTVNGKPVSFDAYTINGNNYFKLRDLAMTLNGTEKQWEISWDGSKNAINMISGKAYTQVGGEMVSSGNTASKNATPSTSTVYIDGKQASLTAYTIGGNNYFKLRDIGQAFDFGVSWDGNVNTISIVTATGYTAE